MSSIFAKGSTRNISESTILMEQPISGSQSRVTTMRRWLFPVRRRLRVNGFLIRAIFGKQRLTLMSHSSSWVTRCSPAPVGQISQKIGMSLMIRMGAIQPQEVFGTLRRVPIPTSIGVSTRFLILDSALKVL